MTDDFKTRYTPIFLRDGFEKLRILMETNECKASKILNSFYNLDNKVYFSNKWTDS